MASPVAIVDVESGQTLETRPGLTITFQNVSLEVTSTNAADKGKKLRLLDSVSGYLEPGKLTALMGPSGSGKTSLMDILAGRKTTGDIQGDILFGGVKPSHAFLRRYTGYVEQGDTLIGTLTVRDMLLYTAELKRPREEPMSKKIEVAEQLMKRLGLTNCANVLIGDPLTKGISGGQAKRTNIGIALISDPRVLFLDEPTSGLDSFSANEVVADLRSLSRSGVTIVATIHSPTAQAFAMFDRVHILVRGATAYQGPIANDAALLFARQHWPGSAAHALGSATAEFLVDMVTKADRDGNSKALTDAYSNSELRKDNDAYLTQLVAANAVGKSAVSTKPSGLKRFAGSKSSSALTPVSHDGSDSRDSLSDSGSADEPAVTPKRQATQLDEELATRQSTATPWWWALGVLLRYRATVNYKNPAWFMPRIADKFLFAIIILTLYLQDGDDFSQSNIVNLGASLFMWTTLPAFGAVAFAPSIVLERRLFYRERADGLYHVITYLIAKLIEEVALSALISVVFSSFVFYGVGYQGSFALYWFAYFLTLANGIVLGYLVAAISPNMEVANASLPAIVTVFLFFAGQLAVLDSIPSYWSWVPYINFMRWSWAALMLNQFEDNNPVFTADGQNVLDYYGMAGQSKWGNASYLIAFFAVFSALAYLALSFIRHSKR